MGSIVAHAETVLTPGFVDGHRHGVGEVEAAAALAHRQAHALLFWQGATHFLRQAAAFRAEQKGIARQIGHFMEWLRALGGEGEYPRLADAFKAGLEAGVALQRGVLVVIQPSTAQAFIVQLEADWLDQVQVTAAVGA